MSLRTGGAQSKSLPGAAGFVISVLMAPSQPGDGGSDGEPGSSSRVGLGLFALYLFAYGGFVGLNAFRPAAMQLTFGGVNLAVIYGLALIVGAFALALLYAALCRGRGDGE